LIEAAQPENVPGMKAYWKNQFEFLGLKAPVRAQLLKPVTILPEGVEVEQLARALGAALSGNALRRIVLARSTFEKSTRKEGGAP
jgi:hypothetical protein